MRKYIGKVKSEMADFGGAREWARMIIETNVREGACVIDATMGNGHDTLWLSKLVGKTGRVHAFDVQEEAVENTRKRLIENDADEQCRLYLKGHEYIGTTVRSLVDAAVFNLGWLPGYEKSVRTKKETTLSAVSQALGMLKTGGVLTVCVYPGHEEGEDELKALYEWAQSLDDKIYDAVTAGYVNIKRKPPVLIAVTKRK